MTGSLRTAAKVGVIVVGTLLFLFAAWLVLTRDIPPIDDSDLALPAREIDPAQNPYPEIRDLELSDKGRERIQKASGMLRGDETLDPEYLDQLLTEFAAELERFGRYAAMTDWQNDQELNFTANSPSAMPWMRISEVKQIEIRRQLDSGDTTAALASAQEIIRFGENLQKGGVTLIQFLIGVTIVKRGQVALVEILPHRDLDEVALQKLANELDNMDFSSEHFGNALRREYQVSKDYIEQMAAGGIDLEELAAGDSDLPMNRINTFTYNHHRTLKLFADAYREMIRESAMVRKNATNFMEAEALRFRSNPVRNFLSGNAIGRILYSVSIPAIGGMSERFAEQQAAHRLIQLQVALDRYGLKYGAFPADLEPLTPEFLDAIPIDPMDGKPLRYDARFKRIYSVGNNYADDGGIDPKKTGSLKGRKEIVIELLPENPDAAEASGR